MDIKGVFCCTMLVMLNVSTKTGDKGETSLADGQRLSKNDLIFEAIGTLDELNSHLGLVVAGMKSFENITVFKKKITFLEKIQHELFTLGGELVGAKVKVSDNFLSKLEKNSTTLQKSMVDDWHNKFVLPGGHEIAARLDVARTVCRRLERRLVALESKNKDLKIRSKVFRTINRLSDYLYVLRCWTNLKTAQTEQFYQAKS